MAIYVSRNVITKENDYANFLRMECGYTPDEADAKIFFLTILFKLLGDLSG